MNETEQGGRALNRQMLGKLLVVAVLMAFESTYRVQAMSYSA